MIQKNGHYIEVTTLPPNNFANCLKCGLDWVTSHGRASSAHVFEDPCRGNWDAAWKRTERLFLEANGELAKLHQWIKYDQQQGNAPKGKGKQTGRRSV